MQVVEAEFVTSAASAAGVPGDAPHVAMVGRSNVGKSSLINALVRQKVARTSAAPGKTRLANYYEISDTAGPFYLVDLPGYGYARGGEVSVESFEALTGDYFDHARHQRRRIAGVLHLIDSRHPALASDGSAHEWLGHKKLAVTVVATKVDKLSRAGANSALRTLQSLYGAGVILESATDRTGLDEVWRTIRSWIAQKAV